MPITKSAQKALRQSKKRRIHNIAKKEAYKAALKEFQRLAASGKMEEAKAVLPRVYKKLDKAAKAKVIEKNKASRLKSKAALMLKKTQH